MIFFSYPSNVCFILCLPVELVPSSTALESLTFLILEGVSLFELGILGEPLELRPSFLDIDDLRRKGMTILGVRERGRRRNTENKGQMTAAIGLNGSPSDPIVITVKFNCY